MSSRIIINADDYAISPGVSRSIRSLIGDGRITATSCMTGSEFWAEDGKTLARMTSSEFSAGLHITLTDQRACLSTPTLAAAGKLPSLGGLWRGILTGRIRRHDLELEIHTQIDRFHDVMGRLPDHIDGHHHIQQLPVIRDIVLDLWKSGRVEKNAWLRVSGDRMPRILRRGTAPVKACIISIISSGLLRKAKQRGIPVNDGFAGVYDLQPGSNFEAVCRRAFSVLSPQMVFMCHPGYPDEALALKDSVTTQREIERRFMESPGFTAIIKGCDGELSRHFDP